MITTNIVKSHINYEQISDADFDEKIRKNSRPIVLTFHAQWSGTSQMFINVVNSLASDPIYDFDFYIVDIEASPHQAALWNIRNVPTTCILNEGEIIDRFKGMLSKNRLRMKLNKVLSDSSYDIPAE